MIRNLQANHYSLPWFTSYNGSNLPFVYPPFGLYFAGLLEEATSIPLLTILGVIPAIINSFSILAFYWLSKTLLPSKKIVLVSVFVYTFLPLANYWLIMGGGITRGFGVLFSTLALWQAHQMYTNGQKYYILTTSALCALTVLSHPETSWYLFYSIAIFWWFFGRNWRGVRSSALVLFGVSLIILPWFLTIISRHHLAILQPFRDSGFTLINSLVGLIFFAYTGEKLVPLLHFLTFLGILACVLKKKYFLPVWFIAPFLLQTRAADQRAVVTAALLISVGIFEIILPWIKKIKHPGGNRTITIILTCLFLFLTLVNYNLSTPIFLKPLSTGERQAMQWINYNTPIDSNFIVITPEIWSADNSSEWLAVLGERHSLAVVQGYEWIPGFSERISRYNQLKACGGKDTQCLDRWLTQTGLDANYIYIVKPCLKETDQAPFDCSALLGALQTQPGYTKVFENSDVSIFEKVFRMKPDNLY